MRYMLLVIARQLMVPCCRNLVIVLAFCGLAACGDKSLSGTYIAKFANGVGLLQLIETPDKHVTGQLQTVANIEGAVQKVSYTVTGAVDGNNVSLSLQPTVLLAQPIPMAGSFTSAALTLTGMLASAEPVTRTFTRGEIKDFEALVSETNEQAAALRAIKASEAARRRDAEAAVAARDKALKQERDFVTGLDALVARIGRFNGAADTVLAKIPAVEQNFRAITAKMAEYLKRERSLVGMPNAGVARSQISVAMNQGLISTDQLHIRIQPTLWDFQNNAVPLSKQVIEAENACQQGATRTVDPEPANRAAACRRFLASSSVFAPKCNALSEQLGQLEAVYRQEHDSQQRMVQEALRIE